MHTTAHCIASFKRLNAISPYLTLCKWTDLQKYLKNIQQPNERGVSFFVQISILLVEEEDYELFRHIVPLDVLYETTSPSEFSLNLTINQTDTDYHVYENCPPLCRISNNVLYQGMWGIALAPNGICNGKEGRVVFMAYVAALPQFITSMDFELILRCDKPKIKQGGQFTFSYDDDYVQKENQYFVWSHDEFTFEEFKQYETITFRAKMKLKKVYQDDIVWIFDDANLEQKNIGFDKSKYSLSESDDSDNYDDDHKELQENIQPRYKLKYYLKKNDKLMNKSGFLDQRHPLVVNMGSLTFAKMVMKTYNSGSQLLLDRITTKGNVGSATNKEQEITIFYDSDGQIHEDSLSCDVSKGQQQKQTVKEKIDKWFGETYLVSPQKPRENMNIESTADDDIEDCSDQMELVD